MPCEISCGHSPWKLKDKSSRKTFLQKFRRLFRQSFEIERPTSFTRISLLGTAGITPWQKQRGGGHGPLHQRMKRRMQMKSDCGRARWMEVLRLLLLLLLLLGGPTAYTHFGSSP